MTKKELIEEMRQAIIGMGDSAINCQDVAQRYAKQKAIKFVIDLNTKGYQSTRHPTKLRSINFNYGDPQEIEQLFDFFNSEVHKEEQK